MRGGLIDGDLGLVLSEMGGMAIVIGCAVERDIVVLPLQFVCSMPQSSCSCGLVSATGAPTESIIGVCDSYANQTSIGRY